ncbi:hypothetical protein AX16_005985 [Volvariella volvacea WC 439]|nr:hypothetical protein AX16_005985 [Volvariella volvacea WC 439]
MSGSLSRSASKSPRSSTDSVRQATHSLSDLRLSTDSVNGASNAHTKKLNGDLGDDAADGDLSGDELVAKLRQELQKAREEKEALSAQHDNLISKLAGMRTAVAEKLKQDAEELDRREQLVQLLTAEKNDLLTTVETLKQELVSSHTESDRALSELDSFRSRLLDDGLREQELRDIQIELERCRLERDEWERVALQDKAISDEAKSSLETVKRELELEREARLRGEKLLEDEREKSENLQSVLQDFQAAKDHELRQAVKDYDAQLMQATQQLAEYKHRALTAELQLEESQQNISRTKELEKEVKEKSLLIGKLRHEAVIMNEHLMEALRRLRRSSSESNSNVDRRLVSNILLQFLSTPRADAKRFEMLTLLASILQWSDLEREKAGLQRTGSASGGVGGGLWGRPGGGGGSASPGPGKSVELEKTDETESFSRLWVEFLLTEAAGGQHQLSSPTAAGNGNGLHNLSIPSSPTVSNHPHSHLSSPLQQQQAPSPLLGMRKLPSFGLSSGGMASTPNLLQTGGGGGGRGASAKGKERARESMDG